MSRRGKDERPLRDPLDLKPTLGFDIEAAKAGSYQMECEPLGPYFRVRFFNKTESLMFVGNREQVRQIRDELSRAIDLGEQYQRRGRKERAQRKR